MSAPPARETETPDLHTVDVNSLALVRPRSVGVEALGLWAMEQLGLDGALERLGFGAKERALAMATIIARMARPGSERATWRWLCERSALGELLEVDFERMSAMRLYRVSDALLANRDALEARLFERVTNLFGLSHTVTLYDLTNTFFEGEAAARSPRPGAATRKKSVPTLRCSPWDWCSTARASYAAPRCSPARSAKTPPLEPMLQALQAPSDALVVMDAGVATEANVAWLREGGYRYLVVSRERTRRFDPDLAVALKTRSQKERPCPQGDGRRRDAALLLLRGAGQQGAGHCRALRGAFRGRAQENSATACHVRAPARGSPTSGSASGVSRKRATASAHTTPSRSKAMATRPAPSPGNAGRSKGTMLTHPGVYCLRTNVRDWDEETLWRTYSTLTDVEAVFRSLKSELGLRPIFHQTPKRAEGHLFITVIAYQLVQTIRRRLGEQGERQSWGSLRRILEGQQRVTATFRRKDGRTLHVRKATRAEPSQRAIYQALGADPAPGGVRKMVV